MNQYSYDKLHSIDRRLEQLDQRISALTDTVRALTLLVNSLSRVHPKDVYAPPYVVTCGGTQ